MITNVILMLKPFLNSWTCLNTRETTAELDDGWVAALDLVKKLVTYSRSAVMAESLISLFPNLQIPPCCCASPLYG